MPIYTWRDKANHSVEIEVIREFVEYQVPPSKGEVGEAGLDPMHPYDWERIIGGGVSVKKGWGWGSKGNW